jgi:hypothetical protein
MNQLKFSWSDYFTGNQGPTLSSGEYTSRQSYSGGIVYVLDCLFNQFTSGSNGGALYCGSSVTHLLIESSSFFSCKTSSQHGGAIYYSNNGGQSVLYGVCGYDCISTYSGSYTYYQFALLSVNSSSLNNNYFNYSSITRCVSVNSKSYYMFSIHHGKICCPSINMSMNKCQWYSGIFCHAFGVSGFVTCSLSYSSFSDNVAYDCICIYFGNNAAKNEIKYCNILRNTQTSSSNGIVYSNPDLMIEDSCILENSASYIFYSASSYTITLSSCTVDKRTNYGSFMILNTVTKSFILGLNHISTRNCCAEYDSAGYLTAIPYISSPTRKEIFSCKQFYHSRISDVISLAWIQLLFWTQF